MANLPAKNMQHHQWIMEGNPDGLRDVSKDSFSLPPEGRLTSNMSSSDLCQLFGWHKSKEMEEV